MEYTLIEKENGYAIQEDGYLLSINNLKMNRQVYTYSGAGGEYRHTRNVDRVGSHSIVIYSTVEAGQAAIAKLIANAPVKEKTKEQKGMDVIFVILAMVVVFTVVYYLK